MRSSLVFLASLLLLSCAMSTVGCGSGASGGGFTPDHDAGPQSTGSGDTGQVCLLNSCSTDDDCAACTGGQTSCNATAQQCVSPTATKPTCATDPSGNPTVTCSSDADCAPCDLLHQVCDTSSRKCVSCTSTQQSTACGPTATCNSSDACVNACPTSCASDADCSQCNGATACNGGVCEQCSATHACPAPEQCGRSGTCVNQCGSDGEGACQMDSDCAACGSATRCQVPINGGAGRCEVPATGCSELGNGVAVLPAPFDEVTNLCSTNSDCSGVGVEYNVGGLLRSLTGISSIQDADIFYGMNQCASLSVNVDGTSLSCGVCVPCKVDSDCQPIDVDPLVSQALGPLGGLLGDLALNEVFGDNPHVIDMYCQQVADGYGACVPCPGVVSSCGSNGD